MSLRPPSPSTAKGSFAISRRLVLQALAAAPVSAALPRMALSQTSGDMALVILSDLHSPYAKLPQLVETVRQTVASLQVPAQIVINGDLFERGNVVALRSGVAADLAALEQLASIAPTVVNIGNHETAILPDLGVFVREASARGADVVSNIIDARTGELYAPALHRVHVGGKTIAMPALATNNIFTYRGEVRDTLVLPEPVAYAQSVLPGLLREADAAVVLSHTGVAADKRMLPMLPSGAMVVGAHDHLRFTHQNDDVAYTHVGSWGNHIGVTMLTLRQDGGLSASLDEIAIDPSIEGDAQLAAMIAGLLDEHLTDEDKAVIGTVGETMSLAESILFATDAVRAATGADVAFLGHTTLGTGHAQGDLTKYGFDAFIRFDGDIRIAEVSGAQLATIMQRANQHEAASLDQRTGDFVYARAFDIDPAATYTVATNGWTAQNQESYLGTTDLVFVETDGLMLKAIVADAIASL